MHPAKAWLRKDWWKPEDTAHWNRQADWVLLALFIGKNKANFKVEFMFENMIIANHMVCSSMKHS